MARKIIFEQGKTKVYENDNGTYLVTYVRNFNFDGMIDEAIFAELFAEDGIHSAGEICTHNLMWQYADDGLSIRERALRYAEKL